MGAKLLNSKKLSTELKNLGDAVDSDKILDVLFRAAQTMEKDVEREAPVDDGDLRRSIISGKLPKKVGKPLAAGVLIGPHPNDIPFGGGKKANRVWRSVEFGQAPGTTPNPFVTRGVKSGRPKARKEIKAGVAEIIKKAV